MRTSQWIGALILAFSFGTFAGIGIADHSTAWPPFTYYHHQARPECEVMVDPYWDGEHFTKEFIDQFNHCKQLG